MRAVKKPVSCSFCGKSIRRVRARAIVRCAGCLAKQKREWYELHAEERKTAQRARREADPTRYAVTIREWQRAHPERMRFLRSRWARAEKKRNAELIRTLPCLDCGMRHDTETRARILSRMLPCSTMDVHGAWPCIWGEGGQENKSSAGTQLLFRDMKAIGAVRSWIFEHSPVYSIPAKRSAA